MPHHSKNTVEHFKKCNADKYLIKKYEDKINEETKNTNTNMIKVRDHDHLTGQYRGAAHILYIILITKTRFSSKIFFKNDLQILFELY